MNMVKNLTTWMMLSVILLLFSCRPRQEKEIHDLWEYLRERPDTALAVLDKYSLSSFRDRRSRAEFALLKSIALDKNYIDLKSDSLIRTALDYYERKGNAREKMLCWYYLGRVQVNCRDFNNAIVSASRAELYLPDAHDTYQEGLIHMLKENIYSHSHNHTEALQEAFLGVKAFSSINEHRQALIAKRKQALDYLSLKDFYHTDSLLLAISNDPHADSSFTARCLLEYARSLALQNRYEESLISYQHGLTDYQVNMTVPQAAMYAVTQYHVGNQSVGDEVLNSLATASSAQEYYLYALYQKNIINGNYSAALNDGRKLMALEDSIAVRTMEQSIIKSQRDYLQQSTQLYRMQLEKKELFLYGILAALFLLVAFTLLIVKHLRDKQQHKETQMLASQEEIRHLLIEADTLNTQLNDELLAARKQYVSAYKKSFSKIASLSETYYRTSGSKNARELVYREVRDVASFISTDSRTYQQLEKNVNSGLSNAMELFRMEYPGKKEEEYRFVCYLMAGFPASTISLLTGLSSSNVYVKKNRLLERLRKDSVEHRDLFLLAIN